MQGNEALTYLFAGLNMEAEGEAPEIGQPAGAVDGAQEIERPDPPPGGPAGVTNDPAPPSAPDATMTAQVQAMVMQALAAMTPAMLGLGGINAIPTLVGPAQPYDGKTSWRDWLKTLVSRFHALNIPKENWVAIVLSLLTGGAASYANANGLQDETTWETFTSTMALGPWAARDTFYSLLWRLTRGNLGNGNPVETVTQLEKIKAKLTFTLPFQFWIFALLANLLPAFRDTLLVGPDGKDWLSYEELRTVVLGKAAAQKSANPTDNKASTKADGKPTKWRQLFNGNAARSSTPQRQGAGPSTSNGAGPSNGGIQKRKADTPACFGCGSHKHRISDRDANGQPVCPHYDESKLRKGKYPMHPPRHQGNGKGK